MLKMERYCITLSMENAPFKYQLGQNDLDVYNFSSSSRFFLRSMYY